MEHCSLSDSFYFDAVMQQDHRIPLMFHFVTCFLIVISFIVDAL